MPKAIFARLGEETLFKNRLTVLNDTVAWDVSSDFNKQTCIDTDPLKFMLSGGERPAERRGVISRLFFSPAKSLLGRLYP